MSVFLFFLGKTIRNNFLDHEGVDLTCITVGTKEVFLRGGPPSVVGGQSNKKVNRINSENHKLMVQR